MNNFLNNRASLVAGIFFLLLSACSSTVPQPTMSLENSRSPMPAFSMHNIGPQHLFESRAIRFVDLNQDDHIDLLIGGRDPVDSFHVGWGDGAGH
jgi:hypothetical protein